MSDRTLQCFDYVNQPYPRVREAMVANPEQVFQRATTAMDEYVARLRVLLGGMEIATDVAIRVVGVEDCVAYDKPATRLTFEWQAVNHPRMFPSMHANLVIFALSPTETQLELCGIYQPPLGKVGDVIDAAVARRFAAASVTRLLGDIAAWLRQTMSVAAPVAEPPVHQPNG